MKVAVTSQGLDLDSPVDPRFGRAKSFLVVDTDTLQVDSIPLTKYKKHIEVVLTEDNKTEAFELARQANADGHHVKVIMKDKVDVTDIKQDFQIVDKTEVDITDRGISSTMTQKDRLLKYAEIKEIPKERMDEYITEAYDIIQNSEV